MDFKVSLLHQDKSSLIDKVIITANEYDIQNCRLDNNGVSKFKISPKLQFVIDHMLIGAFRAYHSDVGPKTIKIYTKSNKTIDFSTIHHLSNSSDASPKTE